MSSDAMADAFSFSVFHCWEYNFVGLNHVLRIPPAGALLLFSLSLCCCLDELGVTHKLGWVSHTHSWVLTCRFVRCFLAGLVGCQHQFWHWSHRHWLGISNGLGVLTGKVGGGSQSFPVGYSHIHLVGVLTGLVGVLARVSLL